MSLQPPRLPPRIRPEVDSGASSSRHAVDEHAADPDGTGRRQSHYWYVAIIVVVLLLFCLALLMLGGVGVGLAMKQRAADNAGREANLESTDSDSDSETSAASSPPTASSDSSTTPEEQPGDSVSPQEDAPAAGTDAPADDSSAAAGGSPSGSPTGNTGDSNDSPDNSVITIAGGGFFGIVAKGKRLVYVVDCSGSMVGAPFNRAKKEVMRSISSLNDDQEYCVILFSGGSYPMYYPNSIGRLEHPTADNLKKTKQWLEDFNMSGGTAPMQAITDALALKPDTIFLLTDGAFEANVIPMVVRANPDKVSINTVCFIRRSGELILKQLAKENRGDYRFVP